MPTTVTIPTPEVPKFATREIWWQPDGQGNAFILVGYCPDTLPYFAALFEDARKTFPDLDASHVHCGKVRRSHYNEGFTFITFNVPGKKRKIEGWINHKGSPEFNY